MIDKILSKNLGYLRGFAAFYIVLHHYFKNFLCGIVGGGKSVIIGSLLGLGQEVVIFFLLLSGFLSYTTMSQNQNVKILPFLRRKAMRIFPLYLFCLLFSCIIQYAINGIPVDLVTLTGNILMLQDAVDKPGNWFHCVGGNYAIWYLSYQWWSYVLFIILAKFQRNYNKRLLITYIICLLGMISYCLWPNQLSNIIWYYWIFETGCYFGMCYSNNINLGWRMPLGVVFMILLWCLFVLPSNQYSIGCYPMIEVRHFVDVLLALLIISICKKVKLKEFTFLKPFGYMAKFSYSVYLLHVPTLVLVTSLFGKSLLSICATIPVVLSVAYIIEVQILSHLLTTLNIKTK